MLRELRTTADKSTQMKNWKKSLIESMNRALSFPEAWDEDELEECCLYTLQERLPRMTQT